MTGRQRHADHAGELNSEFAARLLRTAVTRHGAPTWLVSGQDRAFRYRLVNALLRRFGIRRRYGAVGKKGSISLIERFWRSMKQEYVRHLFLYRSVKAIEIRLERDRVWFDGARPHQGLDQRTPDGVYFDRPLRPLRDVNAGTLSVRFLDGDHRLPVLRPRDVA